MKEQAQHTPGPWQTEPDENAPWTSITTDTGSGLLIAKVPVVDEQDIANARLIAAAPALLEALEDCIDSLEYVDGAHPKVVTGGGVRVVRIERARQAIRQARGKEAAS